MKSASFSLSPFSFLPVPSFYGIVILLSYDFCMSYTYNIYVQYDIFSHVIKTYVYKCMTTLKYHYIVICPIVECVDCFQFFFNITNIIQGMSLNIKAAPLIPPSPSCFRVFL